MAGKGKALAIIVMIGALFAGVASAKPKDKEKFPRPPIDEELPPIPDDLTPIVQAMCDCADELTGYTGDIEGALLDCVAEALLPGVPWPPIPADNPTVHAWWEFLASEVLLFLQDPEVYCAEGDANGNSDAVIFDYGPAVVEGYPYEPPRIHESGDGQHYPSPGMFYILDAENSPIGLPTQLATIARAALGTALTMAGGDLALQDKPRLRREMKDLIACSPWNDAIYGTTNLQVAGGDFAAHGRGLTWYARHQNNLEHLASGRPPVRNVNLNGNKIGVGSRHMQLWIPAVNLDRLLGPNPSVTTSGMQWSNGTSTLVPPPAVMAHSVDPSGIIPPGGGAWGC